MTKIVDEGKTYYINPTELEQALNGDVDKLWGAFGFTTTPQGAEYWMKRASGSVPLSDDDRKLLQKWLRISKGEVGQGPALVPNYDKWDPKNWGL